MVTVTWPALSTIPASCHAFVRTTPCAGAFGSSVLPRNQGKQTGMPPRMACPSSQRDFVLTKINSSPPTGFQDVTCAPWRYISPSAREEVICTRGIAPFPSHTLAIPGTPNWRSSSAALVLVSIAMLSTFTVDDTSDAQGYSACRDCLSIVRRSSVGEGLSYAGSRTRGQCYEEKYGERTAPRTWHSRFSRWAIELGAGRAIESRC